MKLIILIILLCTGSLSFAQKKGNAKDSVKLLQKQMSLISQGYYDSLRNDERYVELQNQINQIESRANNYHSFVLGGEIYHTNFNKFNESLVQSGFPELEPLSVRLAIGYSTKRFRSVFDFHFAIAGLGNKVSKGQEKITTSTSSLLVLNWGYDIVNAKRVSLYPFIGLSLKNAELRYEVPGDYNSNYTNITDFVVNDRSVEATALNLAYRAGLNLDVLVFKNAGIYFYVNGGTDQTIGKEKYKIGGKKYTPDIQRGDWFASFGVKFSGKRK